MYVFLLVLLIIGLLILPSAAIAEAKNHKPVKPLVIATFADLALLILVIAIGTGGSNRKPNITYASPITPTQLTLDEPTFVPTSTPTAKSNVPTPKPPSKPTPEPVTLSDVKILWEQLKIEYNAQLSRLDEVKWASFMRELTASIDEADEKTDDFDVGVALGDLQQLALEYGSKLRGRADEKAITFFENEMGSHFASIVAKSYPTQRPTVTPLPSPTSNPTPKHSPAPVDVPVISSESGENGGGNSSNFDKYDTPEQQNTTSYVLNTSTKKFHNASCNDVKKIKPENYSTAENRADIINSGYDPCKKCKP
jgi:hypothetical protein